MPRFCLPKFAVDTLRGKIVSGELDPAKLSQLDSPTRRQVFIDAGLSEINARQVNALFESKLLLKNQQAGMITWAKKILGMKPDVLRDTLSKIENMTEVLSPKELDMFLEDLAQKKLGFGVTVEEAGKLVDLAKQVEDAKANLPPAIHTMDNATYMEAEKAHPEWLDKRLDYGTKLVLFKDYVASLKPSSKGLTFKEFITTPSKYLQNVGDIVKSVKASIDNSFWGNQGITALLDPRTSDLWVKGFLKSFGDIKLGLQDIDSSLGIKADIFSRPDALNGTYAREKIAIGLHGEEAYPTSVPERIPGLGRLFKSSTNAYNGASLRLRVEIADRMNKLARKEGWNLTDKETAEAIGHYVNSGTGRGSLGAGDATLGWWNRLAFSPRLLKSTFDVVTAHVFDPKVRISPFARKQATYRLMGMVATYVALTSLKEALDPGTTELDPRGPHFGQWKFGNSWVTVIGPYRPLVRTLSTLIPTPGPKGQMGFWYKDKKGAWQGVAMFPTKGMKYGAFTPLDIAESFLEGKASPLLGTMMNHWRGKDYQGNLPTVQGDLVNLGVPITPKNFIDDLNNPKVESAFLNTILGGHGFNVTTQK